MKNAVAASYLPRQLLLLLKLLLLS